MSTTIENANDPIPRRPWNKGKLIGPKPPLQPRHVWAIRTRLRLADRTRDLALFNLGIHSKLRGGRRDPGSPLTTRQYSRLLSEWVAGIGLDPSLFGTHSIRRIKATLIYRRTGNLRAVQLMLGHTKVESTVRYLGVQVDDALTIAEQVDVSVSGRK